MDEELLNGPERVELQIQNGVRAVVEDLDSLRVKFGLDGVDLIVLTPKVETRLRRGYRPLLPMRVAYKDKQTGTSLMLTFPISDYPTSPVVVSISIQETLDEEVRAGLTEVQERLQQVSAELANEASGMGYACSLVGQFQTLAAEHFSDKLASAKEETAITGITSDTEVVAVRGEGEEPLVTDQGRGSLATGSFPVDEEFFFTCRGCRTRLFDNTMLQSHTPEVVATVTQANSANSSCTSWFLQEPLPWMASAVTGGAGGELAGKLLCPGKACGAKLGAWAWSGAKCSCGQWVTPAFQLTRSKLDAKTATATATGGATASMA